MRKIDKSCSLHHSADLVNQPTPLVFSEAVHTLSFLAADRLYMATTWWLHEAEEIAWDARYGPSAPTNIFASAWERNEQ